MYAGTDCFVCGGVPRMFIRSEPDGAVYVFCCDCGGPYAAPAFDRLPEHVNAVWNPYKAYPMSHREIVAAGFGEIVRPMERAAGPGDRVPPEAEWREAAAQAARYRVRATSSGVSVSSPEGAAESIAWDDLSSVLVENRGDGPPCGDTWIVFEGRARAISAPLGAAPEDAMIDVLAWLPWFEIDALAHTIFFASKERAPVWVRG